MGTPFDAAVPYDAIIPFDGGLLVVVGFDLSVFFGQRKPVLLTDRKIDEGLEPLGRMMRWERKGGGLA